MSTAYPATDAVVPFFEHGPVTFPVSAAVLGGQLVMSDGANPASVIPAVAASLLVIGVACNPAVPTSESQVPTVPGWPGPTINLSPLDQYTAVAAQGVYPVYFGASAAFGQRLKPAANGTVVPWVSGTDSVELIVGICYDTHGVTYVSTPLRGQVRLVGLS
jgi:hypothetical protein